MKREYIGKASLSAASASATDPGVSDNWLQPALMFSHRQMHSSYVLHLVGWCARYMSAVIQVSLVPGGSLRQSCRFTCTHFGTVRSGGAGKGEDAVHALRGPPSSHASKNLCIPQGRTRAVWNYVRRQWHA